MPGVERTQLSAIKALYDTSLDDYGILTGKKGQASLWAVFTLSILYRVCNVMFNVAVSRPRDIQSIQIGKESKLKPSSRHDSTRKLLDIINTFPN